MPVLGPSSLLYKGYLVSFPGVKRLGHGVDHQPPSSAKVKETVELYLYSPSGPSWPVLGRTFAFFYWATDQQKHIHAVEYLKQVGSNLRAPAGLHTPHIWYTVDSHRCARYKIIWRKGGTAPLILILGIGWRWVTSFEPWLLYHWRKCPHNPLGPGRVGGPQSQSRLREWSYHNAPTVQHIT
jgi:hypothetical protein